MKVLKWLALSIINLVLAVIGSGMLFAPLGEVSAYERKNEAFAVELKSRNER
jgi:hypothetical protein